MVFSLLARFDVCVVTLRHDDDDVGGAQSVIKYAQSGHQWTTHASSSYTSMRSVIV